MTEEAIRAELKYLKEQQDQQRQENRDEHRRIAEAIEAIRTDIADHNTQLAVSKMAQDHDAENLKREVAAAARWQSGVVAALMMAAGWIANYFGRR